MEIVKSLLSHFDMFTCPATLRTQGKGSTGSYFTGFISTILACFFIYLFYHKSMDIFQFRDISFTKVFETMSIDQPHGTNLMLGIAMDMNATQMMQYFHVYAVPMVNQSYNQTIEFSPCRPEQWKQLGENYEQQFRLSNLDYFLCPESSQSLDMRNVKFSPGYSYVKIIIEPCSLKNCLSWIYPPLDCNCKSQLQIQKFILSKTTKQGYIGVWIKFLDQVVHTESERPIHHYINPDVFLTFTKTRGQIAFAEFDTFVVVTDMGVSPITQNKYEKGYTLDSTTKYVSTQINKFGDQYVRLQLSMSRKKHKFYRKIGKIDRAFSYVGGTLSLLVTIIAFFVKSYNQFKYELRVAQFTFNYDEFGDKVKEKQFTFWKYMHYSIVNWVYVLFLIDINTEQFRQIDDTRDQIGKQLSVQKIFKKIQVLEGSVNFVMKDNYKYFLNLTQPPSIQTVRYRRLITEYYDAIVKGEQELTLSDFGEKRDQSKPKYNRLKRKNRSLRMKKNTSNQQILQHRRTVGGQIELNRDSQAFNLLKPSAKPLDKSKQKVMETSREVSIQKQKRQYSKQKDIEVLVTRAVSQYPSIMKQADSVYLSPELLDTEMFLSQAFIKLRDQQKYKICQKIPVKIIYRLLKIVKRTQQN